VRENLSALAADQTTGRIKGGQTYYLSLAQVVPGDCVRSLRTQRTVVRGGIVPRTVRGWLEEAEEALDKNEYRSGSDPIIADKAPELRRKIEEFRARSTTVARHAR
jgi:hypothetical protein